MIAAAAPANKFGARRTVIDGERFDSAAEARRWQVLRALEAGGKLAGLRRQVRYRLEVAGVHVADYLADFVYRDERGEVVEDVKGVRTAEYRLKRKLMLACHGVSIIEIPASSGSTRRRRR